VVHFKINPKRIGKLPETASAVAHGLRAKLANQGLTGVMFLELDFLSPDTNPVQQLPWTPKDDYVPSVPSTIAQVQDAVQAILARVQAVDFEGLTKHIDGLIMDLRQDVQSGDVHDTLTELRAQVAQANVPALTAQLQKTAAAIEKLASGKPTKELLVRANAALDRLPPLLASLQTLSNRANGGVADIQAQLLPILEQVRVTVQNLREASEAIRRDPGAVLLSGPPPRPAK
jgi:paraquat-inducible protein B